MVSKITNQSVDVQPKSNVVHVRTNSVRKKFSGQDMRQWRRRKIVWMGKMRIGSYEVDVKVSDISLNGAKIVLDLPVKEGARVILSHERFGSLFGKVVWQNNDQLGLAFDEEPQNIAEILGPSAVVLGLVESH